MLARIVIAAISGYKYLISPLVGSRCRFVPSCSDYAREAVAVYGAFRGVVMAVFRLLRCNPWCEGGCDPVRKTD